MFKLIVIAVLLLVALLVSCGQKEESSAVAETPLIDIDTMSGENWLLFGGKIPYGITYQQTKAYVPSLSERRTEGDRPFDPTERLSEAFLGITFAEIPARVEFNYDNDTLYWYTIQTHNIDSTTTEKLGARIIEFYTQHFGEYNHTVEGPEHAVSDYYTWETDKGLLGVWVYTDGPNFGYVRWAWPGS